MHPTLRDGFVTMASAFVATLFYGVPLVGAALSSSPWTPAIDDGAEPAIEAGHVRMYLPLTPADEAEAEEEPRDEVVPAVEPTHEEARGPASEEGAAAPVVAAEGRVAGQGTDGPGPGADTVRPGNPKPGRTGKPRGHKLCDNPHPNIHPRTDGMIDIDRSLVDKYTRNLDSFMSLGFSRPYDEEGLRGWYISGFSCGSPVHKAGFRRGDVLLSVNGKNTRSWIGVYMLYQKLKNKEDFSVQVVRKGEPVTLRFRIVPG